MPNSLTSLIDNVFVQEAIKPLVIAIGSFVSAKAFFSLSSSLHSGYKENVTSLWESYDLLERYGEYVVITKAHDPLGCEFAKRFAEKGHSLILIKSKNDTELDKVLPSINKLMKPGKEIRVITKQDDKGDHFTYEQIEKDLEDEKIKGKIGILLNNAGLMAPNAQRRNAENFLTSPSKQVLAALHIGLVDLLMITKSVLKIMAERKRGLIVSVTTPVNTHSITESGFPVSLKEFTNEYNRIIRREIAQHGPLQIKVEAIHPGPISLAKHHISNIGQPTAEEFVKSAFKSLGKIKNSSRGYWYHSAQSYAGSFVPGFLSPGDPNATQNGDQKPPVYGTMIEQQRKPIGLIPATAQTAR